MHVAVEARTAGWMCSAARTALYDFMRTGLLSSVVEFGLACCSDAAVHLALSAT